MLRYFSRYPVFLGDGGLHKPGSAAPRLPRHVVLDKSTDAGACQPLPISPPIGTLTVIRLGVFTRVPCRSSALLRTFNRRDSDYFSG